MPCRESEPHVDDCGEMCPSMTLCPFPVGISKFGLNLKRNLQADLQINLINFSLSSFLFRRQFYETLCSCTKNFLDSY